ncbi:TlpA family protein disulfide reductase [Owenweeksia hongkongensis]|uniref:TlpA family protein disulfide reductase n=1 Tax=Owenweeksia hongkongensis TaxID=253245 RepID=UPI003A90DA5D
MRTIIIAIFCLFGTFAFSQSEKIRVQAELKTGQLGYTGHGPLVAFKNISEQNPWKTTEFEITGVPQDWTDWYRQEVWFQTYQWTYQNYKAGKVDSARYAELMEVWQFDTIRGEFTSQEIGSVSTVIFMKTNKDDKVEFYADTDLDHDFSDERAQTVFPSLEFHQIDSVLPYAPVVDYELYLDGKVERMQVPFIFEEYGKWLLYTMPLYAEAILGDDTLIVNTSKPDFKEITVSRLSEIDLGANRNNGQKAERGARVKYSGQWYVIDHFDRAKMELVLEVVDTTKDTISPNKGFYAPDFTFNEMTSGKEMKLKDLKGKYVLLDFWGTWCAPCIAEIPDLVELKEELKEVPFEILSIAVSSNRESFDVLKEKHGMDWLHAWQPRQDGVVDEYYVHGYPTFVLLDPKGKVLLYSNTSAEVKEVVQNQKVTN